MNPFMQPVVPRICYTYEEEAIISINFKAPQEDATHISI